ncbi:hypothetical protein KL928_002779 [Ogataea angusta]|uniref:DUF2428 domain-containing protein n=1 Tax=Pichia angusta TaxID=870730 RepID=A0AAN6I6P7_PICAN|nr:uncharacterized protein KL928_002779 [Ogataea angusta]KAG7818911.1 hypothetical protein KL928_002779 [Ogataea angusta]
MQLDTVRAALLGLKDVDESVEPQLIDYFTFIYSQLETDRLSACSTLCIWLTRSQRLIENSVGNNDKIVSLVTDRSDYFLQYIIDFWNESGAPLGKCLRDLFARLTLFIYRAPSKDRIFKAYIDRCLQLPYSSRALYFLLDHLINEPQWSAYVIQHRPFFIQGAIEYIWSNALASCTGKTVSLLLKNLYTGSNPSSWLSLWKEPVIHNLELPELKKHTETYLLPSLFKICKSATEKFLDAVRPNTPIFLGCLRIAQDLAIVSDPTSFLSYDEFRALLLQQDDQLRLIALSLLLSSPKGAMPVQNTVYHLLEDTTDHLFSQTSLETRTASLSLLNNFIIRIRDSSYALDRDAKSLTKKDYARFEQEIVSKEMLVSDAQQFLATLLEKVLFNMRPGSSYHCVSFSYAVLKSLVRSGLDSRVDSRNFDKFRHIDFPFSMEVYSATLIRILIDHLSDDYDDIRAISCKFLEMCPVDVENFVDLELAQKRSLWLLSDMKGKSVDSAGKFFQFLVRHRRDKGVDVGPVLGLLLQSLRQDIDSSHNLGEACFKASVQGYFSALKHIFTVKSDDLEKYVPALIDCCMDIWQITKDVLQNDSPEGNLPEEVEEYSADLEAKYGKASQVVYNYCWRALKESTNLLEILISKYTIDQEQLRTIGEILMEQLATVRHKGAFTSVFPTYVACCKKSNYTKEWLAQTLHLVKHEKISITRRSAGIPFLLTAMLRSDDKLIAPTMDSLVQIAQLPIDKNAALSTNIPQVNAINSIKAIIVDSALSHASASYVGQALQLALDSFGSKIWAVRNCGVMLFAALQTKLFGSKKINNNHLSTISARLFFSRFKTIRSVLLESLSDSISKGFTKDNVEKMYPVLTTLTRLEATPGYEGLQEFKPLVLACLSNESWKLREMAARALPALVSSETVFEECSALLQKPGNLNAVHGSILAVQELITRQELKNEWSEVPEEYMGLILSQLPDMLKKKHYAIQLTYLRLIELTKCKLDSTSVFLLGNWFIENEQTSSLDGSRQLSLRNCANLLLNYYKMSGKWSVFIDFLELAMNSLYDVRVAAIESCDSALPNNVKSEAIRILWDLCQREDWDYVKSLALKCLKNLLATTGSDDLKMVHSLFSLLTLHTDSDIEMSLIEALGPLVGKQLNPLQFDRWFKTVKRLSVDGCEFPARRASLNALIGFNSVHTGDDFFGVQVRLKLFDYLSDDDDELRSLCARHLSGYLGLEKAMVPVEVERRMVDYFISQGQIVVAFDDMFHLATRCDFSQLFCIDSLLFAPEKDNFYKNPIRRSLQFQQLAVGVKANLDSWRKKVEANLRSISDLVDVDGCFGPLTEPNKFNFVYCTLLEVQVLLKAGKQVDLPRLPPNCHPLILQLANSL